MAFIVILNVAIIPIGNNFLSGPFYVSDLLTLRFVFTDFA